jgi:hypothetical protein
VRDRLGVGGSLLFFHAFHSSFFSVTLPLFETAQNGPSFLLHKFRMALLAFTSNSPTSPIWLDVNAKWRIHELAPLSRSTLVRTLAQRGAEILQKAAAETARKYDQIRDHLLTFSRSPSWRLFA